jgi:DedD protein
MAFFKFRKGGDDHPAPAPAPESVEAMRKRARHRLIGAALLVLIGVVGFPMLFDNQPRPVAVDIPIEIPDKAKVKPLTASQEAAPKAPTVAASASKEEVVIAAASATRSAAGAVESAKVAPKVEAKVEPKPVEKVAEKPVAKADDAAKAQALLDGKDAAKNTPAASAPAASATGRFIVQVGAFADVTKAREARLKLEKASLKTYTQVVQTPDGKRIRVRVGPFESHAEADRAAAKIKKLDLPAAILEL